MDLNGKLAPQNGTFNLYNGSVQDIMDATSGGLYRFGNLPANVFLSINASTSLISTNDINGVNGLAVGTGFANIGQLTGSFTYLGVSYGDATIKAFDTASTSNGLSLDFNNDIYKFGSYRTNGNYIEINDTNNSIETLTSNLKFTGAGLETSTPPLGGSSYLIITLNGVQYQILCQIP